LTVVVFVSELLLLLLSGVLAVTLAEFTSFPVTAVTVATIWMVTGSGSETTTPVATVLLPLATVPGHEATPEPLSVQA